MIQLFSRRFGSLAKPRAHRTRMKMKSPTLRSTRLQCGRPEGVRHLFWAISAVGKETLHFWCLLRGFCPHSLKFACLHRTIHTVLRFSQITLSSCSLPTSRRIWATCPLHFLFCAFCVLFWIIWHRDGALTCLWAACQWWVTLTSIDAQWRFEGQHFFEFPIVAAGGGKSEGLRKARSEKGFVNDVIHQQKSDWHAQLTNTWNHSCKCVWKCFEFIIALESLEFGTSSLTDSARCPSTSCKSLQCRLTWNDLYRHCGILHSNGACLKQYVYKTTVNSLHEKSKFWPCSQVVHAEALRPRMLFSPFAATAATASGGWVQSGVPRGTAVVVSQIQPAGTLGQVMSSCWGATDLNFKTKANRVWMLVSWFLEDTFDDLSFGLIPIPLPFNSTSTVLGEYPWVSTI